MFDTNTLAKAKVAHNKRINMFRLLATFTAENDPKKITQRNAQFISSDFPMEDLMLQLQRAREALKTDNIVLLG